MPSRILRSLLVSLVLLVCASLSLYGQSTYGSITGSVADTSGAIVTDANVTLTNQGTQEKRTQSSGADGLFTFVNLFPGQYRIDVQKQGFKHFVRPSVTVEVQQDTHIAAALQVGEVNQIVEVTAETPLLQAETSSLGQEVEQRKANELPLNGRNIFNLITISPAAVAQGGSGGTPVGQNPFSWGNYQIGGAFGNQSAEYLDGQPLNIGYINLPIIIPTQDSIGEFKVQYNNLGAECGKFSGGVMNFSTKSGSNTFHGEAYEFLRNKVLNSNEYFYKQAELAGGTSNTPPPYVQNQYGFNFGGPVIKDKTFFFVSWEQFRLRTGSVLTTTVPLPAFRQGDFSAYVVAQGVGQLYDPYTVNTTTGARTAYPNNQIPQRSSGARLGRHCGINTTLLPQIPRLLSTTSPRLAAAAEITINSSPAATRRSRIQHGYLHVLLTLGYWICRPIHSEPACVTTGARKITIPRLSPLISIMSSVRGSSAI